MSFGAQAETRRLLGVLLVFRPTHSDREDRFQEIALQVWHSVDAYRGDCAATTWIYERLAELDEANRSLALLMLDGFSDREVSQILGLGESNVG
jgi:RNA polymerase sigma-70 factor (ECF subfamily)